MAPYLAISLGILVTTAVAAPGEWKALDSLRRIKDIVIKPADKAIEQSCGKGLQISGESPFECVDINECEPENMRCEQKCQNSYGSYECSCNSGYTVSESDHTKCYPTDACNVGRHCEHICTPTQEGRTCSCLPGYVVNVEDATVCDDINECQDEPCEQTCSNTEGSYVCSCTDGFTVDPNSNKKCIDINECQDEPCEQDCSNTEGSYVCSCAYGFTVDPNSNKKCIDINECQDKPCEQTCSNTEGSYVCSCKDGFTVDPNSNKKCIDTDPCKSSPCEHICSSTPEGRYACSCREGFTIDSTNKNKCSDIDECSKDRPCEQMCNNTEGSYKCSCTVGFAVDQSNLTKCQDIDECKDRPCEHLCKNTRASYECYCRVGFVVDQSNPSKCIEDVCKIKADVLFMLDSSGSVGDDNFSKLLLFAASLTSKFNIGPNDVRFAALSFSKIPKLHFELKDHSTTEALHKALSDIEYMGSSTYTHLAFQLINKQQLFSARKGGRGDAPDIVILFTNGNPVSKDRALASAQKLKDSGVLILGVAIGSRVNVTVLQDISSAADDVVETSSYDTLDDIESSLKKRLCRAGNSSLTPG